MALVHMQLHKGEQFDLVHMEKLMEDLLPLVRRTYEDTGTGIQAIVEPSQVRLPIDKAVPCALVANEFVSNAFKHAFKGREEGSIDVSFSKTGDDSVLMIVKDDGIGIPDDLDIENAETLGLKSTRNIVRGELKGKIKIEKNMGTEVAVEFPI
jgi:two-component sensor histidine kinase